MATAIGDGYALDKSVPGFERDVFDTLTNMLKYSTSKLPDIFETLVISNGRKYRYQKSNEFIQVPTGATEEQLQGLKELRKWRLVEEGGGGSGSGIVTANTATEMTSLAEEGAIVFFTGDDDSANGFFHGDVYRYETGKWNIFDGNKKNSTSVEDWNVGDTKVYTGPDTDTLKRGVTYRCDEVSTTTTGLYTNFVPVVVDDASTKETLLTTDTSRDTIYVTHSSSLITALNDILLTLATSEMTAGDFIKCADYPDTLSGTPVSFVSSESETEWIEVEPGQYVQSNIFEAEASGEPITVEVGYIVDQATITNNEAIPFAVVKATDGGLYVYDPNGEFE